MARKTTSTKMDLESKKEILTDEVELEIGTDDDSTFEEDNTQGPIEDEYELLLSAKAKKLSPKSNSYVYFDLVSRKSDREIYLKLTENDSGGLFTKEYISIKSLLDILDQQKDKSFKSTVLKPAIIGGSSNNPSFVAAALRTDEIGLINPAPNSLFLHVLSPGFDECREQLLALVDADTATETTA